MNLFKSIPLLDFFVSTLLSDRPGDFFPFLSPDLLPDLERDPRKKQFI